MILSWRLTCSAKRSWRHLSSATVADQREAIQLRVVDERGYGAVSEVLEISEPAARARVSRGLRALRRAIASPRGSGE